MKNEAPQPRRKNAEYCVANWTRRRVGGAETYLGRVMPLLAAPGHALAYAFEVDDPAERAPIDAASGQPAADAHRRGAFERIRAWNPDVIYVHGLLEPRSRAAAAPTSRRPCCSRTAITAPVSPGRRRTAFRVVQTCDRVFGPPCLALFYPRRCGGLNPLTMAREYAQQGRPQRAAAAATRPSSRSPSTCAASSSGMARPAGGSFRRRACGRMPSLVERRRGCWRPAARSEPWHLVFLGRMDRLKGGGHLLDALPETTERTDRPLRGHLRRRWPGSRQLGAARPRACRRESADHGPVHRLAAEARRDRLLDAADVLVVPSLWPEPFGLVGTEAGTPRCARGGLRQRRHR